MAIFEPGDFMKPHPCTTPATEQGPAAWAGPHLVIDGEFVVVSENDVKCLPLQKPSKDTEGDA